MVSFETLDAFKKDARVVCGVNIWHSIKSFGAKKMGKFGVRFRRVKIIVKIHK